MVYACRSMHVGCNSQYYTALLPLRWVGLCPLLRMSHPTKCWFVSDMQPPGSPLEVLSVGATAAWLDVAIVRLCSGAGLTDKNDDGKTPVEVAKLNEQTDIATLLDEQEEDTFL